MFEDNTYYNNLDEEIKEGLEKKISFDSKKYESKSIPSKEILDEYHVQIDYQKISYITMDNFNHIIILTKESELYIDNVLYSGNVLKIIEFNKTDLIFIYKDNEVEYYSNKNSIVKEKIKYEKVLYTDNFLATLNKKHLILYYLVNLSDNCNLILDETLSISFLEVDDIELEYSNAYDIPCLLIKNNNGIIKFPFCSISKLS